MQRKDVKKGIYDKIIGLFTRKLQSLGEGLARVKNMFKACGEDLAKVPRERLYKTPSENLVAIHQSYKDKSLNVQKYIMSHEKINYSEYIGQPGYLSRTYNNTVIEDKKVLLDRGTIMLTFAPIQMSKSKLASFFGLNSMRSHNEFRYPASVRKFNPALGEIGRGIFYDKKMPDNSRIIPYTKAVSMGLKV